MAVDVSEIREWLIDGGRSSPNPADMIDALCRRLTEAGIPLSRVGFYIRTLHPDIFGRNFLWKPGEEVALGTVDFDIQDTPEFNASPLSIVFRDIDVHIVSSEDSTRWRARPARGGPDGLHDE